MKPQLMFDAARRKAEVLFANKERGSLGRTAHRKEKWKRSAFIEGAAFIIKLLNEAKENINQQQ